MWQLRIFSIFDSVMSSLTDLYIEYFLPNDIVSLSPFISSLLHAGHGGRLWA